MKENKSYFKSVSLLTIGSIVSVLFLLVQHLLLPFIFTPEELGIKSVIIAVPSAFIAMLCGRYDLCLVYEDDEENIPGLLKLNLYVNLVLSSIATAVTFLYFVFFKQECIKYWYLLPAIWVYFIAYGLSLILNSYNNRYKEYGMIAKMHAIRVAAQCLGTIVLGLIFVFWLKWTFLSVPILVVPYCVGMAVGLRSQGKGVLQRKKEIKETCRSKVVDIAKKHIRQPLLSAPAIFANSFSYSLITIMTNGLYDDATTGYYSLSITLLGLPISLIAGNMSKVYMRDATAEYEETGGFKKSFNKNLLVLTALAVPMFFAMFFLAPPICVWVFGNKWLIAGQYIKALALMFSFRFVSTALSPGLYVCKKQIAELLVQVSFVIVTALSGLFAFVFGWSAIVFLWVMGFARSAVMLVQVILVCYYSRCNIKKDPA